MTEAEQLREEIAYIRKENEDWKKTEKAISHTIKVLKRMTRTSVQKTWMKGEDHANSTVK